MVTGSCHCGRIRFEVTGDIRGFMHCHCATCRKIHGTAYGSSALVRSEDVHLVSGKDELSEYESSPGKKRCFCPTCGSHVYARYDADPGTLVLRMGTLDGDPGVRPAGHIWVSDKAPWYEIHDALPRHERAAPKRG